MSIYSKCHIQSFKSYAVLGMISSVWGLGTDIFWVWCEIMEWHDKNLRIIIMLNLSGAAVLGLWSTIGMYLNAYNELLKKVNQLKNEMDAFNLGRKMRGSLKQNLDQ